jgi:hypothetical protein
MMHFKVSQPIPNCLLLSFDKQKHLALTFCRVQEFYESPKKELNGKYFSFNEFVDIIMDDEGYIDYFNFWTGFNIPGNVFEKWKEIIGDKPLSDYECDLWSIINFSNIDKNNYYIIGALKKDKDVIKHEIAHALYYMNADYKSEMDMLTESFLKENKKEFNKFVKELKKLGYCEYVTNDEIQAYMASSTKNELVDDFKLNYDDLNTLIKKYNKVLRKYNIIENSN